MMSRLLLRPARALRAPLVVSEAPALSCALGLARRRFFGSGSVLGSQVEAAATADSVPVKRVLVSVFDKEGLVDLCDFLASPEVGAEIVSTGGTASLLREHGIQVKDVAELTGFPEILSGRVKSLHPNVHGGILAVRSNEEHQAQLHQHGIGPIDMVIGNLYPFEGAVNASGGDYWTAAENVDIGGPTMIRGAAKNHGSVAVVTSPSQYDDVKKELAASKSDNAASTSLRFRKRLACDAFNLTANYERTIANFFAENQDADEAVSASADEVPTRDTRYEPSLRLKYGNNPHQKPAAVCNINGAPLPFQVINGTPGYINLLDAVNAWQLVSEARAALDLPCAASFKHVSPAGAAVAVPLSKEEELAYEVGSRELTPVALAYLRARNADPLCSFGDFAAVSDVVDVDTARILKTEVSDGIIAPGFEPEALEILRKKKKGNYIILQADTNFVAPDLEFREIYGCGFAQKRNDTIFTEQEHLANVVTGSLPESAKRDLILGSIAVKYTQSNSVGYVKNGMMLGIGAGQQSRVDCVKLAGRKVATWWLRQHPAVLNLKFKASTKRQVCASASPLC
eukprot:INCI12851.1.p1 GENE.INCI12851.1~~INCI12851.1.p1  ORF type:complete len:570 (-),score=106.97 INCI12851.1:409-2118(-)